MTGKLPAILLYTKDWLADPVAFCSVCAQGLWLRMMFIAHDSERYGYLQMNGVAIPPEVIASRCNASLEQYTTLLAELDAAGVPSRTPEGIIYSRRMVNDEKKRVTAKRNGKKGGNPFLNPQVIRQDNQTFGNGNGNIEPEFFELIDESLRVPEFLQAWDEWVFHRRQRKPAIKSAAAKLQLEHCRKMGVARAVTAIRHSIASSYQGIFEPRESNGQHETPQQRASRLAREMGDNHGSK